MYRCIQVYSVGKCSLNYDKFVQAKKKQLSESGRKYSIVGGKLKGKKLPLLNNKIRRIKLPLLMLI